MTRENHPEMLTRTSSQFMDSILGQAIPVLDKGFVRVVDYMGDESSVVQAARVSYGKGTKHKSDDESLIRYLMRNRHTTPFEMCEIKLHVKLPIFVARQWIRHRTANVNEYSGRYSILADEFYVPSPDDVMPQSKTNKQGRSGSLPEDVVVDMISLIEGHSSGSYELYTEMSSGWPWFDHEGNRIKPGGDHTAERHDGDHGLAREMSRMVLPTNVYTEWYWKTDVHNLMHFLGLRADPHAQHEIREYAKCVLEILENWMPVTTKAFGDYVLESVTFSRPEMEALVAIINEKMHEDTFRHLSENILTHKHGVSTREKAKFLSSFKF